MLKDLELVNYRCFPKSKISIKDLCVFVGKNNSGKSTLVEALRMVSMASKKCTCTAYINPPRSLNLPLAVRGFRLPVERLKIDLRSVVHFYSDDIAKVTASFENGTKIVVHVNKEVAFAVLHDRNENIITSNNRARLVNINPINILPQISLIKENEKKLTDTTIFEDMDTYLSSRHFRNEMLLYKNEFYLEFKKMAEETWPGLKISSLEYNPNRSDYICLFLEDAKFPAEVGLMGSGIQMWLQIIWFICRSKGSETIILDEPDVYMHPDLQLRVLKLVKSLFKQVLIATHSIEIISNVSPRNIVTIEKHDRQMKYATHLAAVQNMVDDMGSNYNLSLAKLNSANKCIFVEGKDIKLLQALYNILHPDIISSLDIIPTLPLGGFTRISEAFGAAKLFYDNSRGQFKCYAILDRDYCSNRQIEEQVKKADENNLILHVWNKKEIENYLINTKVLYRVLQKKSEKYEDFAAKYEKLIDTFKDSIIFAYTTKIQENDRSLAAGTAARLATNYVNSKWTSVDDKISITPGKELLRATNGWFKENYNVSCSIKRIFDVMKPEDIDVEIVELLSKLTS